MGQPMPKILSALVVLLASITPPNAVYGQEVLLVPSATQPSPGTFLARSQTRWYQGSAQSSQIATPLWISTGVAPRHSVTIATAGNFSPASSGMSDLELSWKWRFLTEDVGVIDTSRTALIAGLQVPSGTGGWGTGSFNPSAGLAHTKIIGRMGMGLSAMYKLNTGRGAQRDPTGENGEGGVWSVGSSATWRLHPHVYMSDTKGALYLAAEGAWTGTPSGNSVRMGPSLFYEASTWVAEVGWQWYPLNTGSMPPLTGMGVLGLRFFF